MQFIMQCIIGRAQHKGHAALRDLGPLRVVLRSKLNHSLSVSERNNHDH
jgi:hypothetical protein